MDDPNNIQVPEANPAKDAQGSGNNTEQTKTSEVDFDDRLKKEIDRATNALGNDNKKLRERLAALESEKLTEAEKKERAMKEREEQLLQKEAALKLAENRMEAIKALKAIGLDDGTDKSLELIEFIMADNADSINARAKTLKAVFDRLIAAEVDKMFKANGQNVQTGSASGNSIPESTRIAQQTNTRNKTTTYDPWKQ